MNRTNRSRGAVLVEMALISPLIVLMFLGALHFGYLFFIYNGLEKSVRDGARYAASRTITSTTGIPTAYETNVANAVVYGDHITPAQPTPIVPDLTTNMVVVTRIPASGHPERIRVAIQNYQYQAGVLNFLFGPTVLPDKPVVEMPFIGRYAPPPP